MSQLHQLTNRTRPAKARKRVGRGPGSGIGKTCGRGIKGDGARSGYRRRLGKEGGQFPLYLKLPERGFSRKRFQKRLHTINLGQIEKIAQDNDVITIDYLRSKGIICGTCHGLKILGEGELIKKVKIEASAFSDGAKKKLAEAQISYTIIGE